MSRTEFDREIPPDEQLQEVSLILMEALVRIRRGGPPPATRPPPPPAPPAAPVAVVSRPKRTWPKPYHRKSQPATRKAKLKYLFKKRKRIPHKALFWQDSLVSLDEVPTDKLARAVCVTHQPALDVEFREAFDYVMGTLTSDERRLVSLVADRGLTHAARELGVSWRQIDNTLARMREVFQNAGFGPDRAPRPSPRVSDLPAIGDDIPIRRDAPMRMPAHGTPAHTEDDRHTSLRTGESPAQPMDNNAHPLPEVPAASSPSENGIKPVPMMTRDGFAALGGLIHIIEALAAGLDAHSLRAIGTSGQTEALSRAVNHLAGLPSESTLALAAAIRRVPRRMICRAACILAAQRDPEFRSEEQRVARFKALTGASRATYYRVKAGLASTP